MSVKLALVRFAYSKFAQSRLTPSRLALVRLALVRSTPSRLSLFKLTFFSSSLLRFTPHKFEPARLIILVTTAKLHFSLGFVIGYLNWGSRTPSFHGHMPTIVGTFYCNLEGGLSSP